MNKEEAIAILADYDSTKRKRSQAARVLSKTMCGKRGNKELIEWLQGHGGYEGEEGYEVTEEDDLDSLKDNYDRWQKGICYADCECSECMSHYRYDW